MRMVFLGTGEIGVPSLRVLAGLDAHRIAAVFTQPDRPAGRERKPRSSPVKQAAEALGLPVFQPEKIRSAEGLETLRDLAPEVIVVVAYGQLLPRAVLELPRHGCLNVHASLLPRHRGASPVHAAVLAGDTESGLTIMQMNEGLDTGDILRMERLVLAPDETAGGLHDRLAALAPAALVQVLDQIRDGTLSPRKQDESLATYAPKLSRRDGEIDWRRCAGQIDRQVRGLTPWPGAWTWLPGSPPGMLKIHRATPLPDRSGPAGHVLESGDHLVVAADSGSLRLDEVQIAGGRRMAAAEFLRGHPLPVGTVLGISAAGG